MAEYLPIVTVAGRGASRTYGTYRMATERGVRRPASSPEQQAEKIESTAGRVPKVDEDCHAAHVEG